jgi:hypothetical protein
MSLISKIEIGKEIELDVSIEGLKMINNIIKISIEESPGYYNGSNLQIGLCGPRRKGYCNLCESIPIYCIFYNNTVTPICQDCLNDIREDIQSKLRNINNHVEYLSETGFILIENETIETSDYRGQEVTNNLFIVGSSGVKVSINSIRTFISDIEESDFLDSALPINKDYQCLCCRKEYPEFKIHIGDLAICEDCKDKLANELKLFIENNKNILISKGI